MLRARGLRSSNSLQVGDQYIPAYPSAEAGFAVIAAATEVATSLQHADTPLDPSSKSHTSTEPTLSLVALALLCFVPRLGQDCLFHAYLVGGYLILGRINAPVSCEQIGWTRKNTLVISQARRRFPIVSRITFQHPIPTDNASINFVQQDLAPKLSLLISLAPADDLCMRLEDAHQLLCGRNLLALQHPPTRLGHHLLDQGHKLLKALLRPPYSRRRFFSQSFLKKDLHRLGLLQRCLSYPEQPLVSSSTSRLRFLSTAACFVGNLSRQALGTARAVAKDGLGILDARTHQLFSSRNDAADSSYPSLSRPLSRG